MGVKLQFSLNLQTSKLSSMSLATVPRLINDTGGEAFGTRQCGILRQQMLQDNSEMLHAVDLIFAIKGLNLNFRKK